MVASDESLLTQRSEILKLKTEYLQVLSVCCYFADGNSLLI